MLMGHSVEGRFPFLDFRVAEFAARLPDAFRLLGLTEKHVLRRSVAGLVPDEIRARGKQPYRAPISSALVGAAAPAYVSALLSREALDRAGIFDAPSVSRLYEKARQHPELTETEEMALVGVVSTMLLHDQFVANPPPARQVQADRIVSGTTTIPAVDPVAEASS